ncbi:MAG: hypothetical protein V3S98_01275 [Dehalococcoidia bacterium]
MTQTIAYTEQQFIEDVRKAFASTDDARTQAQTIADHMREMFKTGWPANSEKFGAETGTYLVHSDTEVGHPHGGFQILTYRRAPQRGAAPAQPHDHGPCFVVYGVASGSNIQTRYAWKYSEDTTVSPTLEPTQTVVQAPGDAAYFLPGEIHSTDGSQDEETVFVRITSQDLDQVLRHRYNLSASTGKAFITGTTPATT